MRKLILNFSVAIAATGGAHAATIDVHFADAYSHDRAAPIMEAFDRGLLAATRPGTTVTIFRQSEAVDTATVPDTDAYAQVEAFRAEALSPAWEAGSEIMDLAIAGGPAAETSIRLVDILERLRFADDGERDVAIIGSPLLRFTDSPQWSLDGGKVPNDAVFDLDAGDSPFGVTDAHLSGVRIHFCLEMGDDRFGSRKHEKLVERTIALLVEGHGATLATYTSDLMLCLRRAAEGNDSGALAFKRDPGVTNPTMIEVEEILVGTVGLPTEQEGLLANLGIDESRKNDVRQQIKDGSARLARIWLSDARDMDDDMVAFTAAGIEVPVVLLHEEVEVVIPVAGGQVMVTAVRDGGGGGVTLRLRTEDGRVETPVLAPGESVSIPFVTIP